MRFFLITVFGILSSSAFSNIESTNPIYLNGGTVLPKGSLEIPLNPLNKNATYGISCDIENPLYNNQYPVILAYDYVSGIGGASINGRSISDEQIILDHPTSKFWIKIDMKYYSYYRMVFTLKNYDDSDPAYVKNCVANYITQS